MPALTDAQKEALDVHANTEPALQPRSAPRDPFLMGTELRAIGTALDAVADASDLATAITLVNAIKSSLVAAFGVDS